MLTGSGIKKFTDFVISSDWKLIAWNLVLKSCVSIFSGLRVPAEGVMTQFGH